LVSYQQRASTGTGSLAHVLCLSLISSVKLRQIEYTTGDSCHSGISLSNHWPSWYKFVSTHWYHSNQWFNLHLYECWILVGLCCRSNFVCLSVLTARWACPSGFHTGQYPVPCPAHWTVQPLVGSWWRHQRAI